MTTKIETDPRRTEYGTFELNYKPESTVTETIKDLAKKAADAAFQVSKAVALLFSSEQPE